MVDELDRQIIVELQQDGRETFTSIAKKLGVTEGSVRRRVKQLINNKMIRIAAEPNLSRMGFEFMSIIGMQVKMSDIRLVADVLARKPNVCHVAFVTGRYDLMALVVAHSNRELSDFMENVISTTPSILRTETFVNLDVIKGSWTGSDTSQIMTNYSSFGGEAVIHQSRRAIYNLQEER